MDSKESSEDANTVVIVAIDFGTTFSGVCWSLSSCTDIKYVIRDWPTVEGADTNVTRDKIPTQLTYDESGSVSSWGGQVKPLEPRYQEFKLLLNGISSKAQAGLAEKYPDSASLPVEEPFTATRLSVDFLKKMYEWLEIQVEKVMGEATFNSTEVEYVITVPAIWSDEAKSLTRWCAKGAGMGSNVNVMTEPEAAMVHALDGLQQCNIRVDDTYILCDAGGGTVDLVTYIIREVDPLKVDELVAGDGSCCGSVYINRSFQCFLQKELGHLDFWKDEYTMKALDHFEKVAKPRFDGDEKEVIIKIPGIPNYSNDGIRIKKEKLVIPGDAICKMFKEVLQITYTLIKEQHFRARKKQATIKGVIFVGGFAQSPFAQKYLKSRIKWLDTNMELIVPSDGWTAVVQGALSRVLPILCPASVMPVVKSRITRLAYGITYSTAYLRGVDPAKAKFLDPLDGKYYVEKIEWFLYKGVAVREGHQRKFGYVHSWEQGTPNARKKVIKLNIYSYDGYRPPIYPREPGVKKVTELTVDFGRIPQDQLSEYYRRGKPFFFCSPQVVIKYSFASIQYDLWYKGKCYGNVEMGFEN